MFHARLRAKALQTCSAIGGLENDLKCHTENGIQDEP